MNLLGAARLAVFAVLALAPLARGLFYAREQLVAETLLFAIVALWVVARYRRRQPARLLHSLSDLALAGLAVAYWAAVVEAVDVHNATVAAIGMVAGLFIYYIFRETPVTSEESLVFQKALVLSGAAVALVGLAAFTGLAGFEGALERGRLNSTFQYHNSAAAFYVFAYALVVPAVSGTRSALARTGLRAAAVVITLGLLLTVSRGGAVALAGMLGLAFFTAAPGARIPMAIEYLAPLVAALPVIPALSKAAGAHQLGEAWLLIGIAVAAGNLLGVTARGVGRLRPSVRLAAVAAVIATGLMFSPWGTRSAMALFALRVAPAGVQVSPDKLDVFNSGNATMRTVYMRDALSALRDYPVFGAGGGAWASFYTKYQRVGYTSRQVHSFLVQTGVESGAIGVGFLLLFLGATGVTAWRVLRVRRGGQERMQVAALVAGLAALVGHALVDFDLSYLSLFWLVAAGAGMLEGERRLLTGGESAGQINLAAREALVTGTSARLGSQDAAPRTRLLWELSTALAVTVALGMLAFALTLLAGEVAAARGVALRDRGDLNGGVRYLNWAVAFDPRNSDHYYKLSETHSARFDRTGDPSAAKQATLAAFRAVQTNPLHPLTNIRLVRSYLDGGQVDEAAEQAEKLLVLDPASSATYVVVAEASVAAAVRHLARREVEQVQALLAKALAMPAKIEAVQKRFAAERLPFGAKPAVTPRLRLHLGQAQYLGGNLAAAQRELAAAAASPGLMAEADPWLALLYERAGDQAKLKVLFSKPWVQRAYEDHEFSNIRQLTLPNR